VFSPSPIQFFLRGFSLGAASFAPFANGAGFSKCSRRLQAVALRFILSCFLLLGALPFAAFAKGGDSSPSEVCSLGGGGFSPHERIASESALAPEESLSLFSLGAAPFAPFAKSADFSLGGGDFSPHAEAILSRAVAPEESILFSSTIQEPGQPPPPEPPPAPSSSSKHPKQKYSHANDFLIRGTVFTDKALAFPGVQLRIRRTSEKKFGWQDATNSRGEFAIRVPQGAEYEVIVHAKGFSDQAKTIEAKKGLTEERLVFRMEPPATEKGAKK
jgi:hypothetical protein